MVTPTIDPDTNETYPDFGIYGGTTADIEQEYKKYRTADCEQDAIYVIKANAPINTEAHSNVQVQLSSGKVKLLIDEKSAKQKLLGTVKGQQMKPEDRKMYLRPFSLTSVLQDEMANLREENDGINIILKQANKSVRKDKFSSFEYGLYYIKQEEEKKKRRKVFDASEWMLFN